MNYEKIYQRFISDRLEKEPAVFKGVNYGSRRRVGCENYYEHHHILPVALGGTDESSNIVSLSALDHIHAHLLLGKIHGGVMKAVAYIMVYRMPSPSKKLIYFAAKAREEKARLMVGDGNHFFGLKHTKETIEKLSCNNVYSVINKDGVVVTGTQNQIYEKIKIPKNKISAICLGNRKQSHGWRSLEINPELKNGFHEYWKERQDKITLFHKSGKEWKGYPFQAPVKCYTLLNGTNIHVSGWFLSKESRDSYAESRRLRSKVNSECRGDISGLNNPRADKQEYTWKHVVTGEVFVGTRYESYASGKMKKSGVTSVMSGRQTKTNGWELINGKEKKEN
jgi:hypothetical protein